MYFPSLLAIFINPYYFVRRGLLAKISEFAPYLRGRLLDFGCGAKPYRELFQVEEYIGVDIEASGHSHAGEHIDVYYDGKTLPFADDYFDSIFSAEVFEHIFNLDDIIAELYRVLKPGGKLLVTVPFVWDEHEIPYDFARYSSFGLKHLLEDQGFDIVCADKTANYVQTVFQMWNAYVFQHLLPRSPFLRVPLSLLLIAPITLLGLLVSWVLPENQQLYLNNVLVVTKRD